MFVKETNSYLDAQFVFADINYELASFVSIRTLDFLIQLAIMYMYSWKSSLVAYNQ